MFFPRLLALVCALAVPTVAQTTFVEPAKPNTPEVSQKGSLEVARTGNEVLIAWTLPDGEVRLLEIMRHSSSSAPGRGRVAGLRSDVRSYIDTAPDATVTYWYWIKITRPNGVIVNIGPVATPSATVWTPAS